MSGAALDEEIDLELVVDRDHVGDVGIRHSAELLTFTNAAHRDDDRLDDARQMLIAALGAPGVVEAAATFAVFNGLVRVADGTGIQLDTGLHEYSHADRSRLGIDEFAGAANTEHTAPTGARIGSIGELFG